VGDVILPDQTQRPSNRRRECIFNAYSVTFPRKREGGGGGVPRTGEKKLGTSMGEGENRDRCSGEHSAVHCWGRRGGNRGIESTVSPPRNKSCKKRGDPVTREGERQNVIFRKENPKKKKRLPPLLSREKKRKVPKIAREEKMSGSQVGLGNRPWEE